MDGGRGGGGGLDVVLQPTRYTLKKSWDAACACEYMHVDNSFFLRCLSSFSPWPARLQLLKAQRGFHHRHHAIRRATQANEEREGGSKKLWLSTWLNTIREYSGREA